MSKRRLGYAAVGIIVLASLLILYFMSSSRPTLPQAQAQKLGVQMAIAARDNDIEQMHALIDQGADLNAATPDGSPALHWLARRNLADDIKKLTALGAKVDLKNDYGMTPLHVAAEFGASDALKALLDADAAPDTISPTGQTSLAIAAREGDSADVTMLLDHGANPNFQDETYGQTPLMLAIRGGSFEAVNALLKAGAKVNIATKLGKEPAFSPPGEGGGSHGDGIVRGGVPEQGQRPDWPGKMTPLHYVAREGTVEMAKALLERGAKLEEPEANNARPLLVAALNANTDVADFLLDQGANPSAADWYGRTPLWAAVEVRNVEIDANTRKQVDIDRPQILKTIEKLLAKGANPNARLQQYPPVRFQLLSAGGSYAWVDFTGQTAFLRAALAGDVDVMRLLLKHKADPNIATFKGTTPLMAAAGVNWVFFQTFDEGEDRLLEAVRLCHEQLGQDVNAVNSMGIGAVHAAANRGSNKILAYLVSKGARLDLRDKEGRTPYSWAKGVFIATHAAEPKPTTMKLIEELCAKSGQACGIN